MVAAPLDKIGALIEAKATAEDEEYNPYAAEDAEAAKLGAEAAAVGAAKLTKLNYIERHYPNTSRDLKLWLKSS